MSHIRDFTSRRHRRVGVFTPRGFLLIPVLVAIGGLVALGAEGLLRAKVELVAANRFLAKQQALALAEGRVEEVVTAIAADPVAASQWTSCPPPATASLGTTTCTMGPLGTPFVDGPGGVIKQEVQITVSGLVPDAVNPQGRQTLEAVVAVPVGTIFDNGAYGGRFVEFEPGSRADSYDSAVDRNPATFSSSATIQAGWKEGSGSTINLEDATVLGDAFVAPGGSIVLEGTSSISGIQGTKPTPTFPPIRMPQGTPTGPVLTSCPGGTLILDVATFSYSEVSLSNCDVTLNGDGTLFLQTTSTMLPGPVPYRFRLEGNSRLTINGHVQVVANQLWFSNTTVVLGGDSSFTAYTHYSSRVRGDINNPASGSLGRPKDFTVYAGLVARDMFTPSTVVGSTGNKFYGAFYDYQHRLHGWQQVFGSLVARDQHVVIYDGAQLHQDLSLKNEVSVISPSNPIRRRSWHVN